MGPYGAGGFVGFFLGGGNKTKLYLFWWNLVKTNWSLNTHWFVFSNTRNTVNYDFRIQQLYLTFVRGRANKLPTYFFTKCARFEFAEPRELFRYIISYWTASELSMCTACVSECLSMYFYCFLYDKNVIQCFRSKHGKHNLSPSTRVPEVECDLNSAAAVSLFLQFDTVNGNKSRVTVLRDTTDW